MKPQRWMLLVCGVLAIVSSLVVRPARVDAYADDPHEYGAVLVYDNVTANPAPGDFSTGGYAGYPAPGGIQLPPGMYKVGAEIAGYRSSVRVYAKAGDGDCVDSFAGLYFGVDNDPNSDDTGYISVRPSLTEANQLGSSYLCTAININWNVGLSVRVRIWRVYEATVGPSPPHLVAREVPVDGIGFQHTGLFTSMAWTGSFEVTNPVTATLDAVWNYMPRTGPHQSMDQLPTNIFSPTHYSVNPANCVFLIPPAGGLEGASPDRVCVDSPARIGRTGLWHYIIPGYSETLIYRFVVDDSTPLTPTPTMCGPNETPIPTSTPGGPPAPARPPCTTPQPCPPGEVLNPTSTPGGPPGHSEPPSCSTPTPTITPVCPTSTPVHEIPQPTEPVHEIPQPSSTPVHELPQPTDPPHERPLCGTNTPTPPPLSCPPGSVSRFSIADAPGWVALPMQPDYYVFSYQGIVAVELPYNSSTYQPLPSTPQRWSSIADDGWYRFQAQVNNSELGICRPATPTATPTATSSATATSTATTTATPTPTGSATTTATPASTTTPTEHPQPTAVLPDLTAVCLDPTPTVLLIDERGPLPDLGFTIATWVPLPTVVTATLVISASDLVSATYRISTAIAVPVQQITSWSNARFGPDGWQRGTTDATPIAAQLTFALGWLAVFSSFGQLNWLLPPILLSLLVRVGKALLSLGKYIKQILPFQ